MASMLFRGLAALASAGAPGTPHSGRKVDQQQRDVTATALATPLRQGQGRFRLVKVRWMTAACRLMQALLQDSLGKPRGEVEALTQLSRRREWFLLHTKPLAMNTENYQLLPGFPPTGRYSSAYCSLTCPPHRPLTFPVYCSTTQHLPSNPPAVILIPLLVLPIPSLMPTYIFPQYSSNQLFNLDNDGLCSRSGTTGKGRYVTHNP